MAAIGCNSTQPPTAASSSTDWNSVLEPVSTGKSPTIAIDLPADADLLNELAKLDGQLLDLLLDEGGIADGEMAHLADLKSLFHLRIRVSKISDAGIIAYCEHGNGELELEILNLPHSTLTSAGIASLSALPKLRQLRIGGSKIDDTAALELAGLPRLKSLHLIGPNITSDGLGHLAESPQLASLYIDDCPLPDAAWTAFFKKKSGIHVHIDQQHHDRDPGADPH